MSHAMPEPGSLWRGENHPKIRVMAVADNYVMARSSGCYPFVVHVKEFRQRFVHIRPKEAGCEKL